MSIDIHALHAAVSADLPWRGESEVRGTLRIDDDALVLDPVNGGRRVAISLGAIQRAGVETTLGVLPALLVLHTIGREVVRSRFEFIGEQEDDERARDFGFADHVGPGLARDAAARLEGGWRALSGGLRGGRRAMRQVVEGVARQEEYRQWPAAIAQAQEALKRRATAPASHPEAPTPSPAPPPQPLVPERIDLPSGDARALFEWFRREVLRWIGACGARAHELGVQGAPVIQAAYPLDSPVCRIVVAGEFSRGKSTLINALFGIHGEIALPTGMTPTTALACAIRVPNVGETDGATIGYRTARAPLHLTLDAFRASVRLAEQGDARATTDEGVPLHLDEARRLEVRVTGAYLPAGVEIEDTPGLNEQANRSAAALAAVGRADVILFVLAADQLLGDLEQDVLARVLRGHHRNVLFLVNFWDSVEDEAQRAILRQRAATILGSIPSPFSATPPGGSQPVPRPAEAHPEHGTEQTPPVFYVSALQAARAQRQRKPAPEESGIPQLRAFLRELLGPQSGALLLRARAGRALRYVELLQQAVATAGAAAALENAGSPREGDAQGRRYREAGAAATRLLDGLPGAVEGAIAPVLAPLRTGQAPGMQRVAMRIDRVTPESGEYAAALQDARRALAAEIRTGAGGCAQAGQQAVDLVLAQVRAAFLTRGLSAPLLEGHLELAAPMVPEGAGAADLRALLDGGADSLQQACRAGAERLRTMLAPQIQAALPAVEPTVIHAPSEASRQRTAALHALEEDLLRLRQVVRRCVDL